jgi:hypothetical protein
MADIELAKLDWVRGDTTELSFPAHPGALREAGAEFLTRAFRTFGALGAENSILRVTHCETCPGGSTGQKLYLSVEYERATPGLDTDLFVKFSRDFNDTIRDLQRHEMESEVHLAELSRHPAFPIAVPHTYFADFERATGTGLMITGVVRFGEDGIEPQRHKCMDHLLDNPLEHYRAIMRALARIAAAHQAGALSPEVEKTFPFDPEVAAQGDKIPYDEAGLRAQIGRFADLAVSAPQLFPAHLVEPSFIARLEEQAVRVLRHETAIKRYLHAQPGYIALCHWNANIDNAWFWRDKTGTLQCGLLDWGRVRQLNLAYSLWGSLCAAPREIWDDHLDELLELFTGEIAAHGRCELDVDELRLHLDLYVATMGLAGMIVAPDRILFRLPEAIKASGPRDPVFQKSEQARNFLHIFTNFLNLWQRHDFGASLDRMLERTDSAIVQQ